ncbi:hypothetical protein [Campylobacter corcagiensis]|nr:hypothetical protein [Campylobacter corcagiensis]
MRYPKLGTKIVLDENKIRKAINFDLDTNEEKTAKNKSSIRKNRQ